MLNAATMKINLEDFEPIPAPKRKMSTSAINISPSGHVSLNKYLQAEIKQHTDHFHLGFEIHKTDHRILLLRVMEDPNYPFNSDGGKKDPDFSKLLLNNGVVLPARYEVKWNEEASAWVGVLCGEIIPNAVEKSLETARRKRKRVGN